MIERTVYQCVARGCDGCTVCNPYFPNSTENDMDNEIISKNTITAPGSSKVVCFDRVGTKLSELEVMLADRAATRAYLRQPATEAQRRDATTIAVAKSTYDGGL